MNINVLSTLIYLLVSVIVRVDVVVKLLMLLILLVTEFTVEVCSQVFQSFGNCLFFIDVILQN